MKTKIISLTLLLIGILVINPAFADNEKRDVSSFSKISLRVPGKLYVTQGNSQSIRIEAKSETLERIITEVRNDALVIRFPKENNFWNRFKPGEITIHVTCPDIEGLAVSGSGDIYAEDDIKTDDINLAISGSGDIKIKELIAESVKASISGSGDITILGGGTADELSISISGSGDVKTSHFEAEDVEIRVSGSGDTSVNATKTLKVKVAGSGDVYYRGNPQINSSVAGSGSIKSIN